MTPISRRIVIPCIYLAAQFSAVHELRAEDPGRLSTSVQPFVDRQELAGAVMLVASREKVLAVEAAGWTDVAARQPMRTDSIFWIASQSKPITAAALMLLVDEGKVSLDDPVEKYLPEFRGKQQMDCRRADFITLLSSTVSYMFGVARFPCALGSG